MEKKKVIVEKFKRYMSNSEKLKRYRKRKAFIKKMMPVIEIVVGSIASTIASVLTILAIRQ